MRLTIREEEELTRCLLILAELRRIMVGMQRALEQLAVPEVNPDHGQDGGQ